MLNGLTLLLVLQLAGEGVARGLSLPFPGPVVGLCLTLVVLRLVPPARAPMTAATTGLLSHLSLLFVPAGVGVVMYVRELAADWVPIAMALVLSTVVGLAVTAWVAQRLIGDTIEEKRDA
jgi:holin-like protein